MPLLELTGVSVRFGAVQAVDSVDLAVDEGAFVGLIGPNGAGKTSLFNAVTGFARCAAGSIHLDGERIERLTPTRRARRGLVRTFQNVGLNKWATVRENLRTAGRAGPLHHELAPKRDRGIHDAAETAERVGVWGHRDERVADLPVGIAKNVELACALVRRPRLLLLDEPSSGLSPEETDRLGDLLVEVHASDGLAVLMIEHDMTLVARAVSHVYVLNFGSLMAQGTPAAVARDPAVVDAYLGHDGAHLEAAP